MKQTTGLIVMAVGILSLHRLAPIAPQHAHAATVEVAIRSVHGAKGSTSILPADEGSDDSGDSDDAGSDSE